MEQSITPDELRFKDLEFAYRNKDCMALELELQISQPAEKSAAGATLVLQTCEIGGYGIEVCVSQNGKDWSNMQEFGAVAIRLRGEYEREILVAALQKIALLMLPIYGRYKSSPFEPLDEA